MPGTIISSSTRKRIAKSLNRLNELSNNRESLTELYRLARLTLVGGSLFEEVCSNLGKQADKLGVRRKGGKTDA